ncbi:MAG: coenzyme F420-0:L-glutamate ligase [Acetobacteraceae bacterium]|nr:coenzyme F420-0:L-glutamate ligase [Acetobacteraceae bacterium]
MPEARPALEIRAVPGLPMVRPGDDLPDLIRAGLDAAGLLPLQPFDVLVVAQKIVSKAEGRIVEVPSVTPSPEAVRVAALCAKDPRLVEVILRESVRVVRARPNLLIVEHRRGWVMANAGVDHSNVGPEDGIERVLLLPEDPDASAARLRGALAPRGGAFGVVINDSFGRAWRRGTCGVAIGAAGLPGLLDLRGRPDLFGRTLQVSISGFADEIAAAASLVQGQAAEAQPVVLLRGLRWDLPATNAAELVRPPAEDLFR